MSRASSSASIAALMAREIGINLSDFSIKTDSVVPQNLKESIKTSNGLVTIKLSQDQKDLAAFKTDDGQLDEMKINFDDFKKTLIDQEGKRQHEWESLPHECKTLQLYRQLVGEAYDRTDLLSIFKSKLNQKCHRRSLCGLLANICKNADAKLADDPHYVERLTTKVHNAFKSNKGKVQ